MIESKLNSKALQSYTKSFSTIILDKFFNNNQIITGQQIVGLTPIKQVNFFVLKILLNQWQKETKKLKSPFFNYNNQDVKRALMFLMNTLSKHISIEKEFCSPLLERAVKESLILIYDPQTFFNQEINTLDGVNYVNAFKALSRWIKIRKGAFNQIFNELSKKNITQNSLELDELIRKSCEKNSEENIENEINLFNRVLSISILESTDTVNPIGTLSSSVESQSKVIKNKIEKDILVSNEKMVLDTSFDDEFVPLEEVSNIKETIGENFTNVNKEFTTDTQTINKQFKQEKKSTITTEKYKDQKNNLHDNITIKQRYLFMNGLFNGEVNEYNKVIKDIENFQSFDNSVEYLIQNYSRKYQWDMSSSKVKEFLKVIFKSFR